MKSGFCVLWGRPNVGKSTLLNALLGRKHVIVTPRPQTTRNRIVGVLHGYVEEGPVPEDMPPEIDVDSTLEAHPAPAYQVVFLDTPGIHDPQHKLGEALVRTAKSALQDIECVVFVADATDKPHDDDRRAVELLGRVKVPVLLALNKCDIARERAPDWQQRVTEFQRLRTFDDTFEISALQGDGLGTLKHAIVERMPEGDPYFPEEMTGDRPPEFHISELIREQALLQLREEVPHAVAVGIEQMEPRQKGSLYIEAFIFVERDSQKGIVIGKGGSRLKEIGAGARQEIEKLLGRQVYLELRVKVRDKWRESDMWIERMGYKDD